MNIDYVTIDFCIFFSQPDTNLTLKVFDTFFFSKEIWTNTSETMHSMLSNTAKRRRLERRMVKSMESPIFVFPKDRNNLPVGKPKNPIQKKDPTKNICHEGKIKQKTIVFLIELFQRDFQVLVATDVAQRGLDIKNAGSSDVIPDVAGSWGIIGVTLSQGAVRHQL